MISHLVPPLDSSMEEEAETKNINSGVVKVGRVKTRDVTSKTTARLKRIVSPTLLTI